ncbi:integrase (plasmid) [Bradyrhizobium sp. SK17]|jgi:integrase|uniref:integrase n=2 Tax=Bradyrhizobium sp. SK17 TaxID=2057741 RepID=UPI000C316808|nr:integrase [Bradyrhizobium sp. SK17]AUD00092.1 integrase [Bradyrhizobium sp. SK17]
MSARVAATRDRSAPIKISSLSQWTDPQWHLDGMRPGLRRHLLRIDWSFDLPDGSRFTDRQWAAWLEDTRQFLWSMRVDPPLGRVHARPRTLVASFCKLRILIRWMVAERMHGYDELDRDAVECFLRTLASRPSRSRGGTLSASSRHAYAIIILSLYLQRRKLINPPPEHPFAAERASVVSGHTRDSRGSFPYTPDAIAVPLLSAAIRLIGQPADDVIALRNQAAPLYEQRRAQGFGDRKLRAAVVALIDSFRFSTIVGEESPWHPKIEAAKRLRFLMERIYDACFVTIAYLVGARVSEILALEAGCVEHRSASDGCEDFSYLRGRIFKTATHGAGEPHLWAAPPPVLRAIDVLERLSEPLRRRTGRPELWLIMRGNGIVDTRSADVLTLHSLIARLNGSFAPFVALPAHTDGRPWHLTTHQGRKTFARFVGKRDRTGLHALQHHFGHVTRIMTDRAYVGTDFELGELVDAQALDETRAALEELLTASRLGGRAGRMLADRSQFRGRTMDGDLAAYIDFLIDESGMRLGVCDWGYCAYRAESAACRGDEHGPNPTWRTESTCVRCANFAVTERHRPVWEARRSRNLSLLSNSRLDPVSLALARTRIAECDRILAELTGDSHAAPEPAGAADPL